MIFLVLPFLFSGCFVDLGGFFVTKYDLEQRLRQSESYDPVTNLLIGTSNYTFIFVTDTHIYGSDSARLTRLKTHLTTNDRFLLLGGDLVQNGAENDERILYRQLTNLRIPFYPTTGNHDLYYGGWDHYAAVLHRSYYTFVAGQLRVFALDTANGTLGKTQWDWLRSVLTNAKEPLKVIFTHMNIFPPSGEMLDWADTAEVYAFMKLCIDYKVNFVLMGHDHSYYAITNGGVQFVSFRDFKDDDTARPMARFIVSNRAMRYEIVSVP